MRSHDGHPLNHLSSCAHQQACNWYDHPSRTCGQPPRDLPWLVIVALCKYNKKYRVVTKAPPEIEKRVLSMKDFEQRIRCRNLLKRQRPCQKRMVAKRCRTPACNKPVAPEMEAWLRLLKGNVIGAAQAAAEDWKSKPQATPCQFSRLA